jgi:hypothetical protein
MPHRQVLAFRVGCWATILTAVMHMAGHVAGMQPTSPEEARVIAAASERVLALPGATRSIMDLFGGMGLAFSLLLSLWGGLGLIVIKRAGDDTALMYAVARAMAGAAAALLVISLSYWFLIPSMCAALMAISFGVSAVRAPEREGHAH